jgi:anti-sigma-K factor RskA
MSEMHEALTALAPAFSLGALDADERQSFAAHAAQCVQCTTEIEAFTRVVGVLGFAAPQVDPPAVVRARVLAAVGSSARRRAGITRALRSMPYAAAIVAMIGLSAYAASLRSRVSALEARLAQTPSVADVLAAPDLARIDLAGQPATAPTARARALWSRQRGMVFTAANLPPLPPGRVYQVWVVTADARLSAGLIAPDADGRSTGVFVTPPDIAVPVAIAVTLEPAGGVPQPTGAFYLLGRVG